MNEDPKDREIARLKAQLAAVYKLQSFICEERDAARRDRAAVRDELDTTLLYLKGDHTP